MELLQTCSAGGGPPQDMDSMRLRRAFLSLDCPDGSLWLPLPAGGSEEGAIMGPKRA